MKNIMVKVEKTNKLYKVFLKNSVLKMKIEVSKNDKAIFKLFSDFNNALDVLERSYKFYHSYSHQMRTKFNEAILECYIMDSVLDYIIRDIGDVYVKRDFTKYKHIKLGKVVVI